jgi:hypothetical protein
MPGNKFKKKFFWPEGLPFSMGPRIPFGLFFLGPRFFPPEKKNIFFIFPPPQRGEKSGKKKPPPPAKRGKIFLSGVCFPQKKKFKKKKTFKKIFVFFF